MFEIKDLLKVFKNIKDPREAKITIASVLNAEIGSDLVKVDNIKIEKHIIWLKIHPAIRQKLFFKKNEILETIKKHLPDEVLVDIR